MSRRCPMGVPKPNNGGLFRLFCTASSFINPATVSHLSRLCSSILAPKMELQGKLSIVVAPKRCQQSPQKPSIPSRTGNT